MTALTQYTAAPRFSTGTVVSPPVAPAVPSTTPDASLPVVNNGPVTDQVDLSSTANPFAGSNTPPVQDPPATNTQSSDPFSVKANFQKRPGFTPEKYTPPVRSNPPKKQGVVRDDYTDTPPVITARPKKQGIVRDDYTPLVVVEAPKPKKEVPPPVPPVIVEPPKRIVTPPPVQPVFKVDPPKPVVIPVNTNPPVPQSIVPPQITNSVIPPYMLAAMANPGAVIPNINVPPGGAIKPPATNPKKNDPNWTQGLLGGIMDQYFGGATPVDGTQDISGLQFTSGH